MIYSHPKTTSITELRQNATSLVEEVEKNHEPIFIMQNSKNSAVLIDRVTYDELIDAAMDKRDYELAAEALADKEEATVDWDLIKNTKSKPAA